VVLREEQLVVSLVGKQLDSICFLGSLAGQDSQLKDMKYM
jgi:hypothetical protein